MPKLNVNSWLSYVAVTSPVAGSYFDAQHVPAGAHARQVDRLDDVPIGRSASTPSPPSLKSISCSTAALLCVPAVFDVRRWITQPTPVLPLPNW